MPVAPIAPAKPAQSFSIVRVLVMLAIAMIGLPILLLIYATVRESAESLSKPRQAKYSVTGYGQASLTYQNQSGGTEQQTVELPWMLNLSPRPGSFLYISAQKQQGGSDFIRVAIYIDGNKVQEAESNSAYGIAQASGRMP